jgi:hypothetical protein
LINKAVGYLAPLTWIYRVTGVLSNLVKAIEFHKISPNDLIRAMSSQEVTISPKGYHLIEVFFKEKHKAPFKMVKDLFVLPKSILLWTFETSFIEGLPWDLGEWH